MGQELELPCRNSLTEITQKKPDMTIAGSPLLREGSHRTEQTKDMPIQN